MDMPWRHMTDLSVRPPSVSRQEKMNVFDEFSGVLRAQLAALKAAGAELPETTSGIPVKPVYSPQDIPDLDYLSDLGFPL